MEDLTLKQMIEEYRQALDETHDLPLWIRMVIAFFEYHPDPAWIKVILSRDGRVQMLRVNKAYQEQVGISPERYQGQLDVDLWDTETAATFAANDKAAIDTLQPIRTEEFAVNPETGRKQRWLGWKWPVVVGSTVVAICGCALLDPGYDDAAE